MELFKSSSSKHCDRVDEKRCIQLHQNTSVSLRGAPGPALGTRVRGTVKIPLKLRDKRCEI